MANSNRIWCDVWDHLIDRSQCLFHLGKVVKERKTCLDCVCYENIDLKARLHQRQSSRTKEKEPIQKPKPESDQFYTCEELAKVAGRSIQTVKKWAQRAKIPARKFGSGWRFPKKEIHKAMEEATQRAKFESDRFYTLRELVKVLDLPRRRVSNYAQLGKIPAKKSGRRWLFSKEVIDQWLRQKNAPKSEDNEQFYTTTELTKMLGRPRSTISEWLQEGKIPAKKIGRHWRFPKEEIDEWLRLKRAGRDGRRDQR